MNEEDFISNTKALIRELKSIPEGIKKLGLKGLIPAIPLIGFIIFIWWVITH